MVWGAVVVLCVVCAAPVSAESDATDARDAAERIARMRDLAAEPAEAELQPVKPDASGDSRTAAGPDEAAERPLPANESLPLGSSSGGLFERGNHDGGKASNLGGNWLMSTLAALGVVLALVFGLRWLLRRGGVVAASAPQGSVVEVLSRTTVAPRSHVVLMRVGQRILVVNDSPAGMRTLATVEEPEEVAELLGAVDASRPTSVTKSFSSVMGRLSGQWSSAQPELELTDAEPVDGDGVALAQTRGAVSSVRGRLRSLATSGGIEA